MSTGQTQGKRNARKKGKPTKPRGVQMNAATIGAMLGLPVGSSRAYTGGKQHGSKWRHIKAKRRAGFHK